MSELVWGLQDVSSGVEKVVAYPVATNEGVPWNGVVSIDVSDASSVTKLYFDGQSYLAAVGNDEFSASIEALTYPDEAFDEGSKGIFHLSYRETLGETYLLHLVWNATAIPSSRTSKTRANDVSLDTFGWDISTTPEEIDGVQPSAHLVLDPTMANPAALAALEAVLLGGEGYLPTMPTPSEALTLIQAHPFVKVTDNGDGTWTAEGDEAYIRYLTATEVEVESGGIRFIDNDTYTIQSW